MSQIMEKTLASLPKLLTQSLIGGGSSKTQQRQAPPVDVQNFMRHVQRARSKSHEAHIVNAELSNIEQKLKQADLVPSSAVLHSSFTKVLFSHLLGYKANFAAFHAIKLAQQGRGYDKRLGYLMSCLLLHPHQDITLLMMGTIMQDMKSSNIADSCIALKVAGELVDEEVIPHMLPEVISKFSSSHELVREKAIHCFGAFYHRCPELLQPEIKRLNVFLTSRDPGVLMAVMNIFVTLTTQSPTQFTGLGSSFLHILYQINNRGFGSSYYYNMIPLPWLQIFLLKVLGNIGHQDPELSAKLCPILKSLIEKTKVSVPISLAVLVESIQTATKIVPNEALLQLCSRCIMKLLASDSSEDMRYQGLGLLIALSRVRPSFASQHQVAVIECLTNEDPTIQLRTTLLLHAMANRANVKAISSRLFEQLEKNSEPNFRQDIFMMISDLAEHLAPDIDWYLSMNLKILSYDLPEEIRDSIVSLVLRKIEDVSSQCQLVDKTVIYNLTETLLSVLEKENYELAEFSLAVQLLGLLTPIIPDDFSSDRFLNLIAKFLSLSLDDMTTVNKRTSMYSPDYFSNKKVEDVSLKKSMVILKSQCVMTVKKMTLFQCIPLSCVEKWFDSVKHEIASKNSFLHCDLDELADILKNRLDLETTSLVLGQSPQRSDFSLSFLDSIVVKDLLERNECYKPLYCKEKKVFLTGHSLSLGTSSEHEKEVFSSSKNSDDFMALEGHSANQIYMKKVRSKWKDDDLEDDSVIEDEEKTIGATANTSVSKFALDDLDQPKQLDFLKKKKAAEELFAGLGEIDLNLGDRTLSLSESLTSAVPTKKGKSMWDDDDEEDEDVSGGNKRLDIFDVGKIGLNPFGVSKKSKTKWVLDKNNDDGYLSLNENGKTSVSLNNNNQYDSYPYTSSSDDLQPCVPGYTERESLLADDDSTWSNQKETLSTVQEAVPSLSIYSNLRTDLGSDGLAASLDNMSGSTVDALTDSDPEANER